MKTITTSLTPLATALVCAVALSNAHALPPWKQGSPLHQKKDENAASSQPSKDLYLVCKDSKGVMLVPVKNRKEAIAICESGTLGQNHDCQTRHRVHWHNPNHKQGTQHHVMTMVDSEGRPCLTLARIN